MAAYYRDTRGVYRVREFDLLEWLDYGFGTRHAAPQPEGELVLLRQVHSDVCLLVDRVPERPPIGDALLTATPGLILAVRTADCLPILIADPRNRAVAAVHAGWRGTAAGLSAKAVKAMRDHLGSRPEDLRAAMGPGICARCYEVGPEVARQFAPWVPELANAEARVRLDLSAVNHRQLLEAGLRRENLYWGAPCTACMHTEFQSYRRDGAKAGRMLSAITIRRR